VDEDDHATRAAGEMAGMLTVPRFWGIRIRSLAPETAAAVSVRWISSSPSHWSRTAPFRRVSSSPKGWDLHPAQLPTRFAATFAFFREGWAEAAERLGNYHRQATIGVMDEPATAFALARHLAAARACGAVDATELDAVGGISDDVVARYLVRGAGRVSPAE